MTKKKLATTNKLTITYNNNRQFTIPRVKHFIVSDDGKSVTGEYDKTVEVDTLTEQHTIKFTLDLKDVVYLSYKAKHGETSYDYIVNDGRIITQIEHRDNSWYEKRNKVRYVIDLNDHKPTISFGSTIITNKCL